MTPTKSGYFWADQKDVDDMADNPQVVWVFKDTDQQLKVYTIGDETVFPLADFENWQPIAEKGN